MGMVLPIMLSYQNYKEHELEETIKRKNKELREKSKKKYGCKYIWETRCRSFVKRCRIHLEHTKEGKQ